MAPPFQPKVARFLVGANCYGRGFYGQFFYNSWVETYDHLCDSYRKQMVVDDKVALVEMLEFKYDDARVYLALLDQIFQDSDAIILAFDVTAREELDLIMQNYAIFLEFMRRESTPRTCSIPVGLIDKDASEEICQKTSLQTPLTFTCFPKLPPELQLAILRAALRCPDPVPLNVAHIRGINLNILKPRAVTTAEGHELARRLGCKYTELSSKDHEPVMEVVKDLIREHRAWTERRIPIQFQSPSQMKRNPIAGI
ncbi:predicted protein [Histoplasma capsulatum G186AR]|uniref:Uncharacterized protein n=1 Tax=Ajellomyces capsulatus (strain G186AR / H82 / ATCC MYA-2454 / RMSCC 2432) TaxID=447093 RepID=C0NB67_AJECG|nr:uncharacterized protein HCBG_00363 [Histoplasma capsulatum G186AR]EEH10908.1 predicted protein [Histoplasma capsulatum G186AR]